MALPDASVSYETLQPSAGTVLTTNSLVVLSRTTCAKLVGYKLYRYTADNGYSPAEPETVAVTSYTVTAEDLAAPFRLVWLSYRPELQQNQASFAGRL